MNLKKYLHGFMLLIPAIALTGDPAWAQSTADLDARLRAVEEYLEKLPPSMATYAGSLEQSINNYTKNLENGLTRYSQRLEANIESKLLGIGQKTIELDPDTPAYSRIETPTGSFLISVKDKKQIQGGYKLVIDIGNPNYADYRDFTLRLVWGRRWDQNSKTTYQEWRESLTGAVYNFNGKLLKGTWNTVEVDLIPAGRDDLEFLEAELGVAAIELGVR